MGQPPTTFALRPSPRRPASTSGLRIDNGPELV